MFERLFSFANAWRRRLLAQRWARFTLVGGLATASYFLLGLLFVNLLSFPMLVGNALAYALSFIVSYLGQCLWTFEAGHDHMAMLPKFAATQLIGLGINSCIVEICSRLGIIYMFSMVVAIAITPVFVYFICKYWVFRKGKEEERKETA